MTTLLRYWWARASAALIPWTSLGGGNAWTEEQRAAWEQARLRRIYDAWHGRPVAPIEREPRAATVVIVCLLVALLLLVGAAELAR